MNCLMSYSVADLLSFFAFSLGLFYVMRRIHLMSKKLLAAGIVRDIEFVSQYALDVYINHNQSKWFDFKILDQFTHADGSVVIRLLTPYNNTELIKLYE